MTSHKGSIRWLNVNEDYNIWNTYDVTFHTYRFTPNNSLIVQRNRYTSSGTEMTSQVNVEWHRYDITVQTTTQRQYTNIDCDWRLHYVDHIRRQRHVNVEWHKYDSTSKVTQIWHHKSTSSGTHMTSQSSIQTTFQRQYTNSEAEGLRGRGAEGRGEWGAKG